MGTEIVSTCVDAVKDFATGIADTAVTVFDKEDQMEITYVIVGSNEASPAEDKISDMCPIGRALVGKKAGTTVTVDAPNGSFELDILKVERTKNK